MRSRELNRICKHTQVKRNSCLELIQIALSFCSVYQNVFGYSCGTIVLLVNWVCNKKFTLFNLFITYIFGREGQNYLKWLNTSSDILSYVSVYILGSLSIYIDTASCIPMLPPSNIWLIFVQLHTRVHKINIHIWKKKKNS